MLQIGWKDYVISKDFEPVWFKSWVQFQVLRMYTISHPLQPHKEDLHLVLTILLNSFDGLVFSSTQLISKVTLYILLTTIMYELTICSSYLSFFFCELDNVMIIITNETCADLQLLPSAVLIRCFTHLESEGGEN